MKMKTELRYSVIHEVILSHDDVNKAFDLKEYKRLETKSKKFKELYKKNIKKIIKLIEKKVASKKWRYKFIPVYIVDLNLKSCKIKDKKKIFHWKGYGDPITILLRHEKVMLFTLIHELVHNILSIKQHAEWGCKKTENYIHYEVAQEVWEKLNLGDWRKYLKK